MVPTYKGKPVENLAWWRLLKVIYIVLYSFSIVWFLLIIYSALNTYLDNRVRNQNLKNVIESGDLDTARSYWQVYEKQLERGFFGEQDYVEKRLSLDLPYNFEYYNPIPWFEMFLAFGPFVLIEILRSSILYIVGVKGGRSITTRIFRP